MIPWEKTRQRPRVGIICMHRPVGGATAAAGSQWSKIGQVRWCWQLDWMLSDFFNSVSVTCCRPSGLYMPIRLQGTNTPIIRNPGNLQHNNRVHKATEGRAFDCVECDVWYECACLCPACFTVRVQLVLLSSGSAHWATWHHGGATRASPQTGRCAGDPDCRCTASGGCRRYMLHPLQSGAHGGSG